MFIFRHERKEADLLRSLNQAEVCILIYINTYKKVDFFFFFLLNIINYFI